MTIPNNATTALTKVLMSLEVKIKLAKTAANQLESDFLRDRYTCLIIPLLEGVKKDVNYFLSQPEINSYSPQAVLMSLGEAMVEKFTKIEAVMIPQCKSPLDFQAIELGKGIYQDLLEEILLISKQLPNVEPPQSAPSTSTNSTTYDIKDVQDKYKKESVKINPDKVTASNTKTSKREDTPTHKEEKEEILPMYKYPVFCFTVFMIFGIFLVVYIKMGWYKQSPVMTMIYGGIVGVVAYCIAYVIADKKPPFRLM